MVLEHESVTPLGAGGRTEGRLGARLVDALRQAGQRLAGAAQTGGVARVTGELTTRDGLTLRPVSLARGERVALPEPREEVWVVVKGRLRLTGVTGAVAAEVGDVLHVPENTPGHVDAVDDTELVRVSVAGP